jgi:hypothetical protein
MNDWKPIVEIGIAFFGIALVWLILFIVIAWAAQ